MLKRYSQIIRRILSDRAGEIAAGILARDPDFQRLHNQIQSLIIQIQQNLPGPLQNLVLDLDDYYSDLAVLAYEIMYRHGVNDGYQFRRFLKRYANIPNKNKHG